MDRVDIGELTKKSPEELAHEAGYRSARSGIKPAKALQKHLKENPGQMEAFLTGAQIGQREKQTEDK